MPAEERDERVVVVIDEVGQQVNITPVVHAGDLDAGDHADAAGASERGRLVHGPDGVVIGHGHHCEPRLRGAVDELGRREPAVGGDRVQVKVDQGGRR